MSLVDIPPGDSSRTSCRSGKLHCSFSGLASEYPCSPDCSLSLIALILPLSLISLLVSVLIITLVVLLSHTLEHPVPHFLELVQSMLNYISTFYTICSCSRRISPTFY